MRSAVVWCLFALVATVEAVPCAGYMGTVTSTTPATLVMEFPNTPLVAPSTCTWVITGSATQGVVFNLVSTAFQNFINDRLVLFAGVNITSGTPLATYSLVTASKAPVMSQAAAVTAVLFIEPGRRQSGRNITLSYSAPAGQPLLCANGSTTEISSSAVVSNWLPASQAFTSGYYYSPGWSCRWIVQAPASSFVFSTAVRTNMAPGDTLTVIDVGALSNTTYNLARGPAFNVTASNGRLVVDFRSASSAITESYQGFAMTLQVAPGAPQLCSGVVTMSGSTSGVISNTNAAQLTPNLRYLPWTSCTWMISTPAGSVITLNGSVYTELFGDTVSIFDGNSSNAPRIVARSGVQAAVDSVVSSGNSVTVVFQSNSDYAADPSSSPWGFLLTYYAVPVGSLRPTLPTRNSYGSCAGVVTIEGASGGELIVGVPNNITNGYGENLRCGFVVYYPFRYPFLILATVSIGVGDRIFQYAGDAVDPSRLCNTITTTGRYRCASNVAYFEFITDGQSTGDGWGFNITVPPPDDVTPVPSASVQVCQPRTDPRVVGLGQGFGFGIIDLATMIPYDPGQDCYLLVADLGWPIMISFDLFSMTSGDAMTIYAGATVDSPVIYSGINPPSVLMSTTPCLFRFTSDASQSSTNGRGVALNIGPQSIPIYNDGVYTGSVYTAMTFPLMPTNDAPYSGAHEVVYNFSVPCGLQVNGFTVNDLSLLDGDFVELYDGQDLSAPLITRLTTTTTTTKNATLGSFYAPSGPQFVVRIVTSGRGSFSAWGYGVNISTMVVARLPNETCVVQQAPVSCGGATITNAASLASVVPCNYMNGSLIFSASFTGIASLPNLLAVNGDIRLIGNGNTGVNTPGLNFTALRIVTGTVTILNSRVAILSFPWLEAIRFLNISGVRSGFATPFNVTFPNLKYARDIAVRDSIDLQSFAIDLVISLFSFTVTNVPTIIHLGVGSMVFAQSSILIADCDLLTEAAFVSLISAGIIEIGEASDAGNVLTLQQVGAGITVYGDSNFTIARLSSLQRADSVNVQGCSVQSIDVGNLIEAKSFQLPAIALMQTFVAPRLAYTYIFIGYNVILETIILPSLLVADLSFGYNTNLRDVIVPLWRSSITRGWSSGTPNSLNALNASSLVYASCLEHGQGYGQNNFPGWLLPSAIEIGLINPSAQSVTTLFAPKIRHLENGVFSQSAITYYDFPSLETVGYFGWFSPSGAGTFILNVPRLKYANNIGGLKVNFVTLDFPVLQLGEIFFQIMPTLTAINACNFRGPAMQLSCTTTISCADLDDAFGSRNVNGPWNPTVFTSPACNPNKFGIFGCRQNTSTPVDVATCGFSLSCIQASINVARPNLGTIVDVPAGTYTGCGAPLSFNGHALVVRGAGMNRTVIDCGGAGSAFAINQGEGLNSIISDLTIRNAASTNGGGAILTGTSPTFTRVNFTSNRALVSGGGISISGGTPLFTDCVFQSNMATNGGAVFASSGAVPTFQDTNFYANSAFANGGAVSISGSSQTDVVSFSMCVLVNNRATVGGAVFADGMLALRGVTMRGNVASQVGGAVAHMPSSPTGVSLEVTGSSIIASSAHEGGAVYVYSGSIFVTNSNVSSNTASTAGGAVRVQCSEAYRATTGTAVTCPLWVQVVNSTLSNNAAGEKGGSLQASNVAVVINGSVLEANVAATGGAVAVESANITCADSTFNGNAAANQGGAVYCDAQGPCDMVNSVFTSNAASVAGGALYQCLTNCRGDTAIVYASRVLDSMFARNRVDVAGYGNDTATDAVDLEWDVAPAAEVVSGATLSPNADRTLKVQVRDVFGQRVTALSVVSLSLASSQGTSTATLQGPTNVLAVAGEVGFVATTLLARDPLDTARNYILTAQLSGSPTVSIQSTILLSSCAMGQGVPANVRATGLLCTDCTPGTKAAGDRTLPCVSCDAGSISNTTGASDCYVCPANTFQPTSGGMNCINCPANSYSAPGAVECLVPNVTDATTTSGQPAAIQTITVPAEPISNNLYYGLAAAAVILVIIVAVVIRCVMLRTRRKTMEKYLLDDDSTVRAGNNESALVMAVRKMIGASSTTRIGGGQFADVYKARYNDQWIALKVLRGESIGNSVAQQEFQREVVALSTLDSYKHPCIIGLQFFLERNPTCIALEYCALGSLKRRIKSGKPIPEAEQIRIAANVASAIATLHDAEIIHNDIKTDNILFTERGEIKLADFGICVIANGRPRRSSSVGGPGFTPSALGSVEQQNVNPIFTGSVDGTATAAGTVQFESASSLQSMVEMSSVGSAVAFTPQYVDPYRLLNEHDTSPATLRSADVFAFAMVMWAVAAHQEPFAGSDPTTLIAERRARPDMRPNMPTTAHAGYTALLERAWARDPQARPSMRDCYMELRMSIEKHYPLDVGFLVDPIQRSSARMHSGLDSGLPPLSTQVSSMNFDSVAPPPPPRT